MTAGVVEGRLRLDVRDRRGLVVARRVVPNTVFQSGAMLMAELFSGRAATPVNGMGVGTDPQPSAAPYESVVLDVNDEAGQPLVGPVAVALAPDDVAVDTLPDELRVRVTARGVLPPEGARAADGGPVDIAEAALGVLADDGLSLARIYNRVTFEPVPKRPEHDLALYWEVFFPYGP
jgi:hypothetical protein